MIEQMNKLQDRINELETRIKVLQEKLGHSPDVPSDHDKYVLWRELNGLKQTLHTNKQMLVFVIPAPEELH